MTYPITQPADDADPYTWTQPIRDAVAGVNDHQTRLVTLEDGGDSYTAVKTDSQTFLDTDASTDITGLYILAASDTAQEVWTVTLTLDLTANAANTGPLVVDLMLDDTPVGPELITTMPTDGARQSLNRVWRLGPLTGGDHTFRLSAVVAFGTASYTVAADHSCLVVDRTVADANGSAPVATRTSTNLLTGGFKGSNIHPRSADFSGPDSVWSNLWINWDWTGFVKPMIDKIVVAGGNCVRLIGGLTAVLEDGLSQATYSTRQIQVANYCASIGIKYYLCGGAADPLTTTSLSALTAHLVWLGTTMQPYAASIMGYDLVNEFITATNFNYDALVTALTDAMAQLRTAGVTIPLTSSATPPRPGLFRLANAGDFMDFHIYADTPANYLNWLGPLSATRPIVIGEFGGDRSVLSGAEVTSRYTTMLAMVNANPNIAGAVQWAIQDNNFGLYNDAGVQQSDAFTTWAKFPTVTGLSREVLSGSAVGAVTLTSAATTVVGDQLVCIRMADAFTDSTILTAPTGTAGTWTQRGSDIVNGSTGPRVRVWTRSVTTGGAQTVTCATTGAGKANHAVLYVLPAGRTVNSVVTSFGTNNVTARVAPTATAPTNKALLICCGTESATFDFTDFGVLTAGSEKTANSSTAWSAYQMVPSGATGTRTVTKVTGSANWVTASIIASV